MEGRGLINVGDARVVGMGYDYAGIRLVVVVLAMTQFKLLEGWDRNVGVGCV